MWTIHLRLGLAELFTAASLIAVAGLLTLAFRDGWEIALVPGLTYVLAIATVYGLYRRFAGERARVSEPVALATRFRVVDARGVCPLGHRKGAVLTVGAAGAVAPALCAPAEAVLRLAAAAGDHEVEEWCCPVFDHMLVFRRELEAAA